MSDEAATSPTDVKEPLTGPRSLPILGNLLQARPSRFHTVLEAWARQYGDMYSFRLGPRQLVAVSDPDAIRTLWLERPDRLTRGAPTEELFREMGLNGLFSAEGDQWRRQRRIWLGAMNAHQVRPFFAGMTEITERLRQRWARAAAEGQIVDVVEDLMRYTVDVVTLFAYGYDGNTLEQGDDVVQRHLQHVFPALNRRITFSALPYWRYVPPPADWRLRRALRGLRAFVMARIAEARMRMREIPERQGHPESLLEALIAAGDSDEEGFSDDEIYANATTALIAGEDTTALSIAWMIHELMNHQTELDALRAEVDAVMDSDRLWTELEQGDELKLLDAVTRETMRLRPVAPISGMSAREDVTVGGRHFPAGTNFIAVLRAAAMKERKYPDAHAFRPRRWLDEHQSQFIQKPPHPFGGGKRTCPGMNLALLEIKSVMTMLVRNFEFIPPTGDPPVREKFAFTMRPDNLRMRLRPR